MRSKVLVNVSNIEKAASVIRMCAGRAVFFQARKAPLVPGCALDLPAETDYVFELVDGTEPSRRTPYLDLSTKSDTDAADTLFSFLLKYSPEKEVSSVQMAKNFTSAMASFANSGFRTVTKEQHAARMDICNQCPFWDSSARFGLGKCKKCGCTGAKQWLASSSCPIGLWDSLVDTSVRSATEEEFKARLSICKSCRYWQPKAGKEQFGRCGKCGCATKYKLQKADEKCPIGLWGSLVDSVL